MIPSMLVKDLSDVVSMHKAGATVPLMYQAANANGINISSSCL